MSSSFPSPSKGGGSAGIEPQTIGMINDNFEHLPYASAGRGHVLHNELVFWSYPSCSQIRSFQDLLLSLLSIVILDLGTAEVLLFSVCAINELLFMVHFSVLGENKKAIIYVSIISICMITESLRST